MLLLNWAFIFEHVEGGQNLVEVEEIMSLLVNEVCLSVFNAFSNDQRLKTLASIIEQIP